MECIYIKQSQGQTLVELLISLVLGATLSIMMMNAFLLIKKSMLTQQAMIRMQVNARTLDYLLGKALRNSGVFGCQRLQKNVLNVNPLQGITYQSIPKSLRSGRHALKRHVEESDMLWLQSSQEDYLAANITQGQIKSGTLVILSDCEQAQMLRMPQGNITLDGFYQSAATVSVLASTVYYIARSQRKNAKGNPIYGFYSTNLNGRTLELIEGVEKLIFTYGVLQKGKLIYQKSNEIADWQSVISVRLEALFNSVEDNEPMIRKWWNFEWALMINS